MQNCQESQDDTREAVKQLDQNIVKEKIRCAEFANCVNIIQELDTNKPEAFPLLFEFKKDDLQCKIQMEKEEERYYRLGKNDPSRITGIERMQK